MKQLNYSKRDFNSLKKEQINYIKQYYPSIFENYNDASILSVILDLNAAIADNLHFHIDRALQETVLDFAQERQSLFNIAKTYGLKLPSLSASMAICQFSVQVPIYGDAENKSYLPKLFAGSQFSGDGKSFELLYDVDFASNFNIANKVDRTKVPIYNNGKLSAYRITKTGVVSAGATRIFTQKITNTKPFYSIILPENNVLDIISVIHKNGTEFQTNPTQQEFNASDNKWYEVNSLAEDSVFVSNNKQSVDGVFSGDYIQTDRRFIKEFSPNGFCKLTFGSQVDQGLDILDDFIQNNIFDIKKLINNKSLGLAPINNTSIYIKYRVGGGSETNVGVGVINEVGRVSMQINGTDEQMLPIVKASLTVTNVTPAIGGGNAPSIEELRNYIAYNFAAQNRAVTLQDYKSILLGMPPQFGSPAKVSVTQVQNKINVNILSTDTNDNLTSQVSSVVLSNVASYLSKYRMINDYVVVKPAEVINLAFELSVLVEDGSQINVISNIAKVIKSAFDKTKIEVGQTYLLGDLIKKISQLDGLLNINYIKAFNKVGFDYSSSTLSMDKFINAVTREVDLSDGAIKVNGEQILQVKYPDKDIVIIPVVQNIQKF